MVDSPTVVVAFAAGLVSFVSPCISLSSSERRTYARAMAMSDRKGPCCCPCWRWNAFRGLSKFLIAERRWRSRRLATLIDLLGGCGGRGHHHSRAAKI